MRKRCWNFSGWSSPAWRKEEVPYRTRQDAFLEGFPGRGNPALRQAGRTGKAVFKKRSLRGALFLWKLRRFPEEENNSFFKEGRLFGALHRQSVQGIYAGRAEATGRLWAASLIQASCAFRRKGGGKSMLAWGRAHVLQYCLPQVFLGSFAWRNRKRRAFPKEGGGSFFVEKSGGTCSGKGKRAKACFPAPVFPVAGHVFCLGAFPGE